MNIGRNSKIRMSFFLVLALLLAPNFASASAPNFTSNLTSYFVSNFSTNDILNTGVKSIFQVTEIFTKKLTNGYKNAFSGTSDVTTQTAAAWSDKVNAVLDSSYDFAIDKTANIFTRFFVEKTNQIASTTAKMIGSGSSALTSSYFESAFKTSTTTSGSNAKPFATSGTTQIVNSGKNNSVNSLNSGGVTNANKNEVAITGVVARNQTGEDSTLYPLIRNILVRISSLENNPRIVNNVVNNYSSGSLSGGDISVSAFYGLSDSFSRALESFKNNTLPTIIDESIDTALANFSTSQWTTTGLDIYFSTGNVGIGTTTPGATLSVVGSGSFTGNLVANGNITASAFYGDGSNLTGITSFSTSTTRSVFSSSATGLTYTSGTGDFSLTSGYNIPLTASTTEWASKVSSQWTTSGSDIAYTNGKVGIGTSSPSADLAIKMSSATSRGFILQTASGQSSNIFEILDSSYTQRFYITPSYATYMNVSNGTFSTSSPALTVKQTAMFDSGSASTIAVAIKGRTSQTADLQQWLDVNNTILGVVTANGSIGIGTSTPSARLAVTGTAGTSDVFAIASSTNARMFTVTSAGKVGIGISSPQAMLDINSTPGTSVGDLVAQFTSNDSWQSGFTVANTSSNKSWSFMVGGSTNNSGAVDVGNFGFYNANTSNFPFIMDNSSDNVYLTASSGNVGIGTKSPGYKLSIAGDVDVTGALRFGGDAGTSGYILQTTGSGAQWVATSSLGISSTQWTTSGSNIYYTTGSVGIGSTTPASKLSVTGTAGATVPVFTVASSTNTPLFTILPSGYVGVGISNPSGPLHIVGSAASGPVQFIDAYGITSVNGGAAITMRGARGTASSPSSALVGDMLGGLTFRGYGTTGFSSGSKGAIFGYAAENWTDSAQGTYITIETTQTNSTTRSERLRIDSSGNVGIGTSTPSARLAVTGNGTGSEIAFSVADSSNTPRFYITDAGAVTLGNSAYFTAPAGLTFTAGLNSNITFSTTNGDFNISNGGYARGVNGGVTVPSFSFQSDTNTGLYRMAEDKISLVTGGSDRLIIDSSGNVGIGTASPSGAFHLYSNGDDMIVAQSGVNNAITIGNWDYGSYKGAALRVENGQSITGGDVDINGGAVFGGGTAGSVNLAGGTDYAGTTAGNVTISGGQTFTGVAGYVQFNIAGSEVGRFANNGKFGIGTTTPSSSLTVWGTTTANALNINTVGSALPYGDILTVDGTRFLKMSNSASTGVLFLGYTAGKATLTGNFNTGVGYQAMNGGGGNNNTIMGFQSFYRSGDSSSASSNTVIGSSALSGNFAGASVVPSQNTIIGASAGSGLTSGANNILIGASAGTNLTSGSNNIMLGTSLSFASTTGSYQLNIGNIIYGTTIDGTSATLSSGNIGIGTTTPASKLSVTGTAGATVPVFTVASSTNTPLFTILPSGYVGIGTSTSPTFPLDVYATVESNQSYGYLNSSGVTGTASGVNSYSIRATGRIIASEFNAVSDARLKDVQFDLDSSIALNAIGGLRPVSFTWKDNPAGQPVLGLLAQEVEQVIPNAVSKISTDKFTDQREVSYNQIVTVIIGAVKELKKQLETVKTQLASVMSWFGNGEDRFNIRGLVCVDDVCVTKDQFKQMLINSGSVMVVPQGSSDNSSGGGSNSSNSENNTGNETGTVNGGSSTTTPPTESAPEASEPVPENSPENPPAETSGETATEAPTGA